MSIKHRHSNIRALFLIVLCFTISGTHAFYPNRFKKCDQSGFCRRNRDRKDLQPITVKNIDFNGKSDSSFTSELTENDVTTRTLQSKLTFYEDGIVNIKVTETSRTDDLAPRFDAAELVMQDSKVVLRNEKVTSETAESYKFSLGGSEGAHLGSIEFPKDGKNFGFRVVDENGEELIVADSLLFENHMKKPEAPPKKEEQQPPRDPIPPPRRHRHNPDNPDAPEDLDLPPPPPPHEGEEEIIPEGEEQVPEEVPEQVPEQAQDNVVVEEVKKEEEEKKEEEKPVKEIDGGWEEHFDGGHDSKPNGKIIIIIIKYIYIIILKFLLNRGKFFLIYLLIYLFTFLHLYNLYRTWSSRFRHKVPTIKCTLRYTRARIFPHSPQHPWPR